MKVADLFCGGGCFSVALQLLDSPPDVVLGVDNCAEALQCFMQNHADARASGVTLPATHAALQLPDADHWHLSPPCVAFSSSRRGRESEEDVALGSRLLAWSVEFAIQHGVASYSIENVAVDAVRRQLQRLKEKYPADLDYVQLDSARLGGACDRARLVAGRPGLVARLKALPARPLRTVAQAMADAGLPLPDDATHVRAASGTYRRVGEVAHALRCVSTERSHTLVASRALVWARADGSTVRQLRPAELAALMGLSAMKLPKRVSSGTSIVGNGIEASMARAIGAAAAAELAAAAAPGESAAAEPTDRAAVDAAVRSAVEEHVAWWSRHRQKRRLVTEQAVRDGVSRAKVCRILDELDL